MTEPADQSGVPERSIMDELLPYGTTLLHSRPIRDKARQKLRCPVRGCTNWLTPPTRKIRSNDVCPDHGIQVHGSGTYSYADYRRNLITDADWFDRHIRRHPFKYEAHRFGQERSEDAVTWNVFRSFQKAGSLKAIASMCMGVPVHREPRLFLWGLEIRHDGTEPWNLLSAARERFESDLPVDRPKTEPDIALFEPGQYLILIEAKFTSANGVYERDRVTKLLDLTIDQLITIYRDRSLQILDYEVAQRRDRILYQLWRNMTFAEWMSRTDSPSTKAYHANLVREGYEGGVCEEFLTLIRPDFHDRFEQICWEEIYRIALRHRPELDRLCRYMETKTERLVPAFRISPATRTRS